MKIKMQVKTGDLGGTSLDAVVLQNIQQSVMGKVANLVCPEHGVPATVEVAGDSLQQVKFKINACCDAMKQKVVRALR